MGSTIKSVASKHPLAKAVKSSRSLLFGTPDVQGFGGVPPSKTVFAGGEKERLALDLARGSQRHTLDELIGESRTLRANAGTTAQRQLGGDLSSLRKGRLAAEKVIGTGAGDQRRRLRELISQRGLQRSSAGLAQERTIGQNLSDRLAQIRSESAFQREQLQRDLPDRERRLRLGAIQQELSASGQVASGINPTVAFAPQVTTRGSQGILGLVGAGIGGALGGASGARVGLGAGQATGSAGRSGTFGSYGRA